jgi:citrate lyase beta subunit
VLAAQADAAGIQRVGVDLERLGKRDRQRGRGTWISSHTEHDLRAVGAALARAQLFARVNPLNEHTAREVASVLAGGAQVLMLPMVASATEAARFVELVAGRALVVLLVERVEALDGLSALVAVEGVAEVHIGLNDLALSMGLSNRWLALADDRLAEAGACVRTAGLRFGLGGIGRVDDDSLPVPSDLVYAEYARTGARAALLSRSFFHPAGMDLAAEVERSRRRLARWCATAPEHIAAAHAELGRRARQAAGW